MNKFLRVKIKHGMKRLKGIVEGLESAVAAAKNAAKGALQRMGLWRAESQDEVSQHGEYQHNAPRYETPRKTALQNGEQQQVAPQHDISEQTTPRHGDRQHAAPQHKAEASRPTVPQYAAQLRRVVGEAVELISCEARNIKPALRAYCSSALRATRKNPKGVTAGAVSLVLICVLSGVSLSQVDRSEIGIEGQGSSTLAYSSEAVAESFANTAGNSSNSDSIPFDVSSLADSDAASFDAPSSSSSGATSSVSSSSSDQGTTASNSSALSDSSTIYSESSPSSLQADLLQSSSEVLSNTLETQADRVVADKLITYQAIQDIDAASDASTMFSLVDDVTYAVDGQFDSLESAITTLESQGYSVGCFFLNLNTGNGISYNLDTRIYGASSFKGPYATYLSEHLIDGGAGLSTSSRGLLDAMVLYSDNDAFTSLRNAYDSSGFTDWLTSCDVDAAIANDTHYPRYSARESALLWLRTYRYLETDTEQAQHLTQLFSQTNVSFIRDGVQGVYEEGADEFSSSVLVVMNKAGWNASGTRFSGLCDAGIIECDGEAYMMSVMCSAPDSESHRSQVSAVAAALFSLRQYL